MRVSARRHEATDERTRRLHAGRRGVVRSLAAPAAALLAASMLLAGCTGGGEPAPAASQRTTASPPPKVQLSFGVYGPDDEVSAYQAVVDAYNGQAHGSEVKLRSWPDHEGMVRALKAGSSTPDVFMVSRDDLSWLQDQGLTQPVDDLLDERGVDFGDGYSRDGLQSFSADNRLQCMPLGISPMVIYYNTDLVDFARMQARGLDAPDPEGDHSRWTLDQFAAAAAFATRPRHHTKGVYVTPSVTGLSPFIYSGGGKVFDDDSSPTSLAFSDGDTQAALQQTLELLRNPHLTLTQNQLERAPGLKWFERGRVGMIEGYRSLVPELRHVPGLHFDVMPMPSLDSAATTGDISGLCLSKHAASTSEAADFMVHALSAESVGQVARAGYLAPANLQVADSDDFLQPGRMPEHASVFNNSTRSMQITPLLDSWPRLEEAVGPTLQQMVNVPILDDLPALTEEVDSESRTVLDPNASPSPSDSPS